MRALKRSAAAALCAVLLAGCAAPDSAAGTFAAADDGCYAPLACGPMYPAPVYPYYAHPYLGYLHDPAHTVIVTTGGRTSVVYRPYSPPLRPAFRAPAPRYVPPPPAARPAAPKPAQPRTAARPATRK
jgi:hypothetical protein